MPSNVPGLPIWAGGQMTDLPAFNGSFFVGTELMEIVSPGDELTSLNYAITTQQLANLLINLTTSSVIIVDGQYTNPLAPYVVPPTVGRVYVDKTLTEMTYVQFGLSAFQIPDALVADIGGTQTDTNFIKVTFSGGETADKLAPAEVNIMTPFGGYFFRPVAARSTWHLGTG